MTKEEKGCVDRISEDKMVIISEEIDKEFVIDKSSSKEQLVTGDWLIVTLNDSNEFVKFEKDIETTKTRKGNISKLLNEIRNK